ncbi:MAG: endolytic transglycosylase MltG [Anaerolineales bacterium]|nr:endolytic transglycosylase MltG [Anaerolineales bacterium]
MRPIARIALFAAAVLALLTVAANVTSSLRSVLSGAATGGISVGLCGVSSPDELAIGAYLQARASELAEPAGTDDTPVTFTVEQGETVAQIAERLVTLNLVTDAELFRRYVQYHELDSGIEAGQFTLRQTMTIPQIAKALQEAQRPEQLITVREGLRLEEVAEIVGAQTTISQDEFIALATRGWRDIGLGSEFDFLAGLPPEATLEGFLFPDTYRLDQNASALDLVNVMLGTFATRVPMDVRAAAGTQGLTVHQMVTLASIIEREAVLEEERPLIAGVYYNRLRSGWLLAADPTVQYGLGTAGNWWPQLSLADLEAGHAYNTYQLVGLPPGPICSPGASAIRAAAYPTETNYFFFLADCQKGDGSHWFSATEEEHYQYYEMCGGGRN